MVDMPHAGWYLLAFIDELAPGLNPVDVGPHALIAIRDGQDVRVFDGRCPHRGAHLAFGGVLDRGCVICPFHAKAIRLGEPDRRLGVRQHPVAQAGAAVFVRIGSEPAHDRGFEVAIKQIEASYQVLPATRCVTRVPPEMVVENAFDVDHFFAVHKVPRMHGMDVSVGDAGELIIDGEFRTATAPWGGPGDREEARRRGALAGSVDYAVTSRFLARAYSPGVVVTHFGDQANASVVITGAVPLAGGGAVARVAVGVVPGQEDQLPGLVTGAQKALREDVAVWDHLDVAGPERLDARDKPVLAFRQFCTEFTRAQDVTG